MRKRGKNVKFNHRVAKRAAVRYNGNMQTVQLTVGLDTPQTQLKELAAKKLGIRPGAVRTFVLLRRSVDARHRDALKLVYSVGISTEVESVPCFQPPQAGALPHRPIVVGFGPGGMLCALVLAEAGLRPIVLERGDRVENRSRLVNSFWQGAPLDPECNVQFGEGGAGAFSDGKLNTGTGDKLSQRYVLETFVRYGAPEAILYDSKPHVGTDRLVQVVRGIRERILSLGGEIHFREGVQDVLPSADGVEVRTSCATYHTAHLVLAIGHSARDTYQMLSHRGFAMEAKPFSVGVRCEHRQKAVSRALYGAFADHPALGPADYKLVQHTPFGGVYSFCMCPGGVVVASSSEPGTVVTNGMSYSARDGVNANAALLVGVGPEDYGSDLFDGVRFQLQLEQKAFALGGEDYKAPCQCLGDFLAGHPTHAFGSVLPTYQPGVRFARLDEGLPTNVRDALRAAFAGFGRKIKGFDAPDTLLTGYETRSSSPLRILRNEQYRSLTSPHVYPCGEGCGYAGGIMSAATDGIHVACQIIQESTAK